MTHMGLHLDADQAWLVGEVKRYSYKPGCQMWVTPPEVSGNNWMLHLQMRVPDSRSSIQRPVDDIQVYYRTEYEDSVFDDRLLSRLRDSGYDKAGPTITVQGRYAIPRFFQGEREQFRIWLTHTLMALEEHEMREWLRYDGELVDDPHAPEARR